MDNREVVLMKLLEAEIRVVWKDGRIASVIVWDGEKGADIGYLVTKVERTAKASDGIPLVDLTVIGRLVETWEPS